MSAEKFAEGAYVVRAYEDRTILPAYDTSTTMQGLGRPPVESKSDQTSDNRNDADRKEEMPDEFLGTA